MFSTTYTHEQVIQLISDAVVDATATPDIILAVSLPVLDGDRVDAEACAHRHQHNNRRFANQPKYNRGKNQFATIVRGYIGEIVIRKALGLPHSIDDLVFDKPQKRPDLMALAGHDLRLDIKTTEDGTARINQESHLNPAKRPLAYVVVDVQDAHCHVWAVDADAVDAWDQKPYVSPHYLRQLPPPPLQ